MIYNKVRNIFLSIIEVKRYFIYSAIFTVGYKTINQNFGCSRNSFPTVSDLKGLIRGFNNGVEDIVILSISEVSKKDFKRFFSEQE